MADYKNIVLNAIKDNADKPLYKAAWDNIQLLGEDSKAVNEWLKPYMNCKDEFDFLIAYECGIFPKP